MAKIAHKILEKCAIFHIIIFSDITTVCMTCFYENIMQSIIGVGVGVCSAACCGVC